jgi:hypothetical protein
MNGGDDEYQQRHAGVMRQFANGLTSAIHGFWPSLGRTLPYMLMGLAIGSGLFATGSLLETVKAQGALEWLRHKAVPFIDHLAAGFFVSAVAVFFYEWGAHVKHAIGLSDRLVSFLSDSEKYAKYGLREVLGAGNDTLIKHQQQFIAAVADLHRKNEWYSAGYVTFLARFIRVASENAESLHLLSSDMLRNPHHVRPYILSIPGPEIYADDMLTEQMNALVEDDHYDTFSNPETWLVPLVRFKEAGDAAVERGVHIRRMLILGDTYSESDSAILTGHFRSALTTAGKGSYSIQIIDTTYLRDVLRMSSRPHYGIFRHGPSALLFEVEGPPTLTKFRLVGGSLAADARSEDLSEKANLFERAWKITEQDRPLTAAGFVDLILEREVRHIVPGGRYDAVSTIAANANLEQRRLAESLSAAIASGVAVRRIVAMQPGDKRDHPLIRRYVDEAQAFPPGGYIVKVCQAEVFAGLETPFVTIHRTAGRPHRDVFAESCSDDLSDFLIEERSSQYAQRFDLAWRDAVEVR